MSQVRENYWSFESDLFDRLKGQIQRDCQFHIVVTRLSAVDIVRLAARRPISPNPINWKFCWHRDCTSTLHLVAT